MQSFNSTRPGEQVAIKQQNRQHISVQYSHEPVKEIHRSQHHFSVSEEQGRYIELESRQSIGTSFAAHHAMLLFHGKRASLARISSLGNASKRCINAVRWRWFSAVKWFRTTRLLLDRSGVIGSVIKYGRALARSFAIAKEVTMRTGGNWLETKSVFQESGVGGSSERLGYLGSECWQSAGASFAFVVLIDGFLFSGLSRII